MVCNAYRGEVAMPFGEGELVLRLSYGVLAKMIPLLAEADEATVSVRKRAFKRETTLDPPEPFEWQHHLIGAIGGWELPLTAELVALAASEHRPGLTVEEVMRESPPFGPTLRAFIQAINLQFWRPGQQPQAIEEEVERIGPFVSTILSRILSPLRREGASPPSGNGRAPS